MSIRHRVGRILWRIAQHIGALGLSIREREFRYRHALALLREINIQEARQIMREHEHRAEQGDGRGREESAMALKVEWKTTDHGSFRAEIGRLGSLRVHWDACRPRGSDDPPYVASALGVILKSRYATADEAKAAAESVAEKLIREAAALLRE